MNVRDDSRTGDAELILYAVPTGELAVACDRYWRIVTEADRHTTAQTYPPHCTLTGFFHRAPGRIAAVVDDVRRAVPAPSVPSRAVDASLRISTDWVGLELRSSALAEAIDAFVSVHRPVPGEDALRPKSWLHLSVAYGDGLHAGWHGAAARDLFDRVPPGDWRIGLWRRLADGSWIDCSQITTDADVASGSAGSTIVPRNANAAARIRPTP